MIPDYTKQPMADLRAAVAAKSAKRFAASFNISVSSKPAAGQWRLMDSERTGETIINMHWRIHELAHPRFGFLTGDNPIMISNGIGHERGFVVLPISPTRFFIAAHDLKVTEAFVTQSTNAIERAFNDACVVQSRHVIIAANDQQRTFVDRRFLVGPTNVGPNGYVTWNLPQLVDV